VSFSPKVELLTVTSRVSQVSRRKVRTNGLFVSMRGEGGGIICVCFKGFEGGGVDGGRVDGFFHSSQNEEICGD